MTGTEELRREVACGMEEVESLPSFIKPSRSMQEPTAHLYVANCGPVVGISFVEVRGAFEVFGPVASVQPAGDSGSRVYVSYHNASDAVAAREAWNSKSCDALRGRVMVIQHAVPRVQPSVELFPVSISSADLGIPGVTLFTDFICPMEEQNLLDGVDERPWQTLAKRRVQHYGYEFLYKTRNVDLTQKLGGLPSTVEPILKRISAISEIANAEEPSLPLDQLTVNEYSRGVGLSPHIDTHSAFEGSILSLSLAGPCIMEFRKYIKKGDAPIVGTLDLPIPDANTSQQQKGPREQLDEHIEAVNAQNGRQLHQKSVDLVRKALFLPQRSLLMLSKEARYAWHHYIPHHKVDDVNGQVVDRGTRRVSFTFRKVRPGPCNCEFSEHCDSQSTHVSAPVSDCLSSSSTDEEELRDSVSFEAVEDGNSLDEPSFVPVESLPKQFNSTTPEIEKKYVHKVYDAIAPHFSATRFAKWPKVALFLESLKPGSIIADAGCGNGKYLGFNPKCFFIGCDISPPLIAICEQQGHEALVADALRLPYRTGFCDAGISIAVLHHLSNEERRVRAIEELLRVVSRKGRVLFTVWAVEQEDKKLLTKWTPLTCKYMEEWVDNMGTNFKRSLSTNSLGSIKEGEGRDYSEPASTIDISEDTVIETVYSNSNCGLINQSQQDATQEDVVLDGGQLKLGEQQEYFVPWHLPYHRAEIGGASAAAVASGLARKDDIKRAVVYNRYYHCFVEGELERLASQVQGAKIIDHFYDKSNWCVVLEKL